MIFVRIGRPAQHEFKGDVDYGRQNRAEKMVHKEIGYVQDWMAEFGH